MIYKIHDLDSFVTSKDKLVMTENYLTTQVQNVFAIGQGALNKSPYGFHSRFVKNVDAVNQGKIAAFNILAHRVPYIKVNFSYYKLLGQTFFRTGFIKDSNTIQTIGKADSFDYLKFYLKGKKVRGFISCGQKYNRWNLILR